MAEFNLVMPKMGESVQEATITKWLVKPGDTVTEDDPLVEIATDKVDTEIPSPVAGKIGKLLFGEGSLVPVGEIIAVIDLAGEAPAQNEGEEKARVAEAKEPAAPAPVTTAVVDKPPSAAPANRTERTESQRFYSPLVKNIARKENIPYTELDNIAGSGVNGRVTKTDMLEYLETRKSQVKAEPTAAAATQAPKSQTVKLMDGDVIVEMDRLRKLIAEHMVISVHTSPHVTNFIEADVTNLVMWRNRVKDDFFTQEKIKLTFMPAFTEAAAIALKEFPGVNASVDGTKIILRKNINIGIAVALPTGNLIVPVVKQADQRNLRGLATEISRLSDSARKNKLAPDDIQGGTFTITNFGTFGNTSGTPIINQPEVAILATGAIVKKPAVIETPAGDAIAIRHIMVLSLSYDHRVVDGSLGGQFLKRVAELLENFDTTRIV